MAELVVNPTVHYVTATAATGKTWAQMRTAAGASAVNTDPLPMYIDETESAGWVIARRMHMYFDLSSLPAGATVSAATLAVRVVAEDTTYDLSYRLIRNTSSVTTQAGRTSADHLQVDNTVVHSAADLTNAVAAANTTHTFTLTAAARTAIAAAAGGFFRTTMSVAEIEDGASPTLTGADEQGGLTFTLFGGANAPVLTINYTEAADPPTLTSIDPDTGTTAGGTAFEITGTDFVTGAEVTFGGDAATDVSVDSATTITGVTPAHAAGAVDVVVTNPDDQTDTLTDGFTFEEPAAGGDTDRLEALPSIPSVPSLGGVS